MSNISPEPSLPHKVIFLDIDGVLVTTRAFISNRAYGHRRNREFDITAAGMIRAACMDWGVKLVISSTWRFGAVMDKPSEGTFGMLYANLEKTKLREFVHEDWRTIDLHRFNDKKVRGDEIAEWLGRHPEVDKYAILDDDSDMLPEQLPRFVHTEGVNGILYKHWLDLEHLLADQPRYST